MVNEPIDNRDQIIADLRQQLAEKDKEIYGQRVGIGVMQSQLAEARAEAADWKLLYKSHAEEIISSRIALGGAELDRDRANAFLAAQAAELATLRERLAAAERFRFGSLLFSCSNNGWECFRMSDGSYLGDPPHSNTFIYKTFDEAYQAAIADGWIPPSAKGEG